MSHQRGNPIKAAIMEYREKQREIRQDRREAKEKARKSAEATKRFFNPFYRPKRLHNLPKASGRPSTASTVYCGVDMEEDIDDEQDYEGRRLLQHRRRAKQKSCLSRNGI